MGSVWVVIRLVVIVRGGEGIVASHVIYHTFRFSFICGICIASYILYSSRTIQKYIEVQSVYGDGSKTQLIHYLPPSLLDNCELKATVGQKLQKPVSLYMEQGHAWILRCCVCVLRIFCAVISYLEDAPQIGLAGSLRVQAPPHIELLERSQSTIAAPNCCLSHQSV